MTKRRQGDGVDDRLRSNAWREQEAASAESTLSNRDRGELLALHNSDAEPTELLREVAELHKKLIQECELDAAEDHYWDALAGRRDTKDAKNLSNEEFWRKSRGILTKEHLEALEHLDGDQIETLLAISEALEQAGFDDTEALKDFFQKMRLFISTLPPAAAKEFMEANRDALRSEIQVGLDDLEAGRFIDSETFKAAITARLLAMKKAKANRSEAGTDIRDAGIIDARKIDEFGELDREIYCRLLTEITPKVIEDEKQLDRIDKIVYDIAGRIGRLSPEEDELLGLLSILIDDYQTRNPI